MARTHCSTHRRRHSSTRRSGNGGEADDRARRVYLVELDPTRGSEIQKTRPCVVVSPDELNRYLRTVIIAPMTTGGQPYPWRVPCRFQGKAGAIAVDQLRTVDGERLTKRLGVLPEATVTLVLERLTEFFAL